MEFYPVTAGYDGIIYLHSSVLNLGIFSKAYIISHEIQHLIKRSDNLVYSPLIYRFNPKVLDVFSRLNEGVPLEAGHLYWSILTNYLSASPSSLEATLKARCSEVLFWNNLDRTVPFIDLFNSRLPKNHCCNLPFSFDVKKPKKFFISLENLADNNFL